MNKEDIIRMAREAGFADSEGVVHAAYQLERFFQAAYAAGAAAEREECAKLCEAGQLIDYPTVFERAAINKCATAIRARGNK